MRKTFITVISSCAVLGIAAAFGAFWDVQNLKREVRDIAPVAIKNKKLLCLIGIKIKINERELEKLCLRED